jgi:hypothetical protein
MKRPCLRAALFTSCLLVSVACIAQAGCDDSNAIKEPPPDSGGGGPGLDGGSGPDGSGPPIDGGGDGAPSDCFMNPQTHLEIINACTNAVKITKNPVLAKLYPDGGLPPTN